jgi:thioredoxin 1
LPPSEFNEIIAGNRPVLVEFYAEWCEPCKWLEPVLNEIDKLVGEKAFTWKVDIEKNPDLREAYGIMSVPVMVIFKNGKEQWRMNGFTYAGELSEKLLAYVDPQEHH